MERDDDFGDIAFKYYSEKSQKMHGCFSELEQTPPLPRVKISSDHCAFCFHGQAYVEIFENC
jgi:hypothetical protein